MNTITPKDFAALAAARALQVKRYRAAFYNAHRAMPKGSDIEAAAGLVLVSLESEFGPVQRAFPVLRVQSWARSVPGYYPLSFSYEITGRIRLSVRRADGGESSMRFQTWGEVVPYWNLGNRWNTKPAPIGAIGQPIRLVAICAGGPRQEKVLQPLSDSWERLPADSFKESGTNVSTVLLTITN